MTDAVAGPGSRASDWVEAGALEIPAVPLHPGMGVPDRRGDRTQPGLTDRVTPLNPAVQDRRPGIPAAHHRALRAAGLPAGARPARAEPGAPGRRPPPDGGRPADRHPADRHRRPPRHHLAGAGADAGPGHGAVLRRGPFGAHPGAGRGGAGREAPPGQPPLRAGRHGGAGQGAPGVRSGAGDPPPPRRGGGEISSTLDRTAVRCSAIERRRLGGVLRRVFGGSPWWRGGPPTAMPPPASC